MLSRLTTTRFVGCFPCDLANSTIQKINAAVAFPITPPLTAHSMKRFQSEPLGEDAWCFDIEQVIPTLPILRSSRESHYATPCTNLNEDRERENL
jgi:hypothetical protein